MVPSYRGKRSLSHFLSPGSPERSWIWPGGPWGLTLERSRHLLHYRSKLQVRSWRNCLWFIFFSSVYIWPPWEWLLGDTPTSLVYKNICFFGGWEDGEFLKRKKYALYTSRFSNNFAQSFSTWPVKSRTSELHSHKAWKSQVPQLAGTVSISRSGRHYTFQGFCSGSNSSREAFVWNTKLCCHINTAVTEYL